MFAVFGILRYRTEAISIRDLTYLFIVIGLGIQNAVIDASVSLAELLAVNTIITALAVALEVSPKSAADQSTRPILYDALDLLKPGAEMALLQDLKERTGLDVQRVEVHRIDMIRDTAELTIYYVESKVGG